MSYPNNSNYYLPGVVAIPSTLQIIAITQANPMVCTTTYDPVTSANIYIPGMLVKLMIPNSYGMQQANGLVGQIIAVVGALITLDINSSGFDAFAVPLITAEQPASMAPNGSRNLQYNNQTLQVPCQSLNNIGN